MQHLGGDYVGYTRMQVQGMFALQHSRRNTGPVNAFNAEAVPWMWGTGPWLQKAGGEGIGTSLRGSSLGKSGERTRELREWPFGADLSSREFGDKALSALLYCCIISQAEADAGEVEGPPKLSLLGNHGRGAPPVSRASS